MRSTPTQYGRVAIVLHWSIAALILVALASGFAADAIGRDAHGVLRAHVASGLLAGLLTLVRVGWWLLADTRPDPAPNAGSIRGAVARAVHALLIIVPLGMAASGIGMLVLTGAGAQLFGGAPGALPEFETVLPRRPHGLGAWVLVGLVALHVGAALYHHLVLRDRLLARLAWRP
jgi:cytochrome b561